MEYPKISIVTPNYNGGAYLESTIRSLLDQDYPNLEYIVIDGGSTDNSLEIISRYRDRIAYFTSEKDKGLYEAIDKGFKQSTGEIMGWLNSDDMHHRQSLFAIAEIFDSFTGLEWLMGNPTYFDEQGRIIFCWGKASITKYDLMTEDGHWLQQESTFWRRSLWKRAGGFISQDYKYAGDFELWIRFFNHAILYSTDTLLAGFRFRSKNQLTLEHFEEYKEETRQIRKRNNGFADSHILKRYKHFKALNRLFEKSKFFNHAYFDKYVRARLGFKTPFISFDRTDQCYKLY